jgi:para-aminobenzoate synthetase/4-amino-4-deoxychorismate lyase
MEARRAAPAEASRAGPHGVPHALGRTRDRPDPALGVFETVLVEDGVPVRLGAHLERLEASMGAVYGEAPAPDLAERVRALAATAGKAARLRIVAAPRSPVTLELAPLGSHAEPLVLVPWILPGGLGSHKWRDRRLLEALAAARGGVPLLVDATGEVLEAAWANVVVLLDGAWRTPPADGRLLPGTARARLLADERVVEEPVTLDQLREADAVSLTSALRTLAARLG